MSVKSTSIAAAVALTLWGAGAEAREFNDMFTLRGYGTAGLTYSDEDQADFVTGAVQTEGAGFSEKISGAVDSKSALQLDMTFTDRLSGVVQIISEGAHNNTWDGDPNKRFFPSLEWANLAYRVTDEVTVRAGRIVLPFFAAAEYRKVGFANHWVRPPVEVYGLHPFTSSDGADVTYRTSIRKFTNTLRVHYGKQALRSELSGGHIDVRGASDAVEVGALTVRAAYMDIHFRALGEGLGPLFNGFAQMADSIPGGQAAAAEARRLLSIYDPANLHEFKVVGLSFNYDPGQWFVMGEAAQLDSSGLLAQSANGYVSGGYRLNRFTPYATYALHKVELRSEAGVPLAGLPEPVAGMGAVVNGIVNQFARMDSSQQTFTVGMRWDFASSMALKAQYDYVDLADGAVGLLANQQPGFKLGSNVNVFSVTLDYVF